MKAAHVIAMGGALGLAAYLMRFKSAGEGLLMDVAKVEVLGISLSGLRTRITYQATNPSSRQIALDYVFADAYAGSTKIAQIRAEDFEPVRRTNPSFFVIQPDRTSYLPMQCTITALGIVQAAVAWLSGSRPKSVRIDGYVKAEGIRTTFSQEKPLTFNI